MKSLKPIKTRADYEAAIEEMKRLWGAKTGTPDGDRLDILATLVDTYETRHFPMDPPDPIEAIKFRMEQQGLTRKDLEGILGTRTRVAEVLNRHRGLSIGMIRRLHEKLGISAEVLIRPSHDCGLATTQLADLVLPSQTPEGQPAPALKFGQPRVTALLGALCLFVCTPEGITNGRLRPLVAQLLGVPEAPYTTRQMGYDLRRLVRKGLLRRVPGKLCYTLTPYGRRVALFLTKVHTRVLRPGLQALDPRIASHTPPPLRNAFTALDGATDSLINKARLAA